MGDRRPRDRFPSNGATRLRVATTCGSPLVVLISGRLPAQLVGRAISVDGAFRRRVRVVGAINSHLFAVDTAADHSVTNAFVGLDDLDDLDESVLLDAPGVQRGENDAEPCSASGTDGLRLHGQAS